MTTRADWDPGYFRRFLWMALACGAAGAWFFFDGSYTYPNELKRCQAYWSPIHEDPNDPDRITDWEPIDDDKWVEIAKKNNWSKEKPSVKPDEQRDKIGTQFFYAIGSTLIAIPCLLKWFLSRGTWIEGDENGLNSSWGQKLAFSQVESVNKRKWEDKGIAKIRYNEDGRRRTFVLDDFKYQRKPMNVLIRHLEAKLTDEQIIGGDRQPDPSAAKPSDQTETVEQGEVSEKTEAVEPSESAKEA